MNQDEPLEMLDTIVSGTRHVLEFAAATGTRSLLLLSSGAVYGRQPADCRRIPEDFNGSPLTTDTRSAYGEGKRIAELLGAICARHVPGLGVKIARCFAFVGPHLPLDAHFAIGNFIRDVLDGKPLALTGDGTPFRSYLYAADLSIWLWTILFDGVSLRPYNVGSENDLTISDTARMVRNVAKATGPVTIAGEPDPSRPAERYVPSTERARNELGLRESVPLDEAIRRTIAWNAAAR